MPSNLAEFEQYTDRVTRELVHGPETWPEVLPFAESQTAPFPVDCLPAAIADHVREISVVCQVPPEMPALLSLGVLATCYQGRYWVRVNSKWKEELSLFVAAAAKSGARKSPAVSELTDVILDYEQARRELDIEQLAKNRAEKAQLEQRRKAALSGRKKKVSGDDTAPPESLVEVEKALAEFKEMHPLQLITGDCTQEELAVLLEQQSKMTISTDEGAGLFRMMSGGYKRQVDLDIYLKGYSGTNVAVNRVGRAPVYIVHPHLSIVLTVQPETLASRATDETFTTQGLWARFLFVLCDDWVGDRLSSPPEGPQSITDEYRHFIWQALDNDEQGEIRLSPEADRLRDAFQQEIEIKLGTVWTDTAMRLWGSKLVGQTLRIAGLIHCAESPDIKYEPLSADTLNRAIRIAQCLATHAEAVLHGAGSQQQADTIYVWEKLKELKKPETTKRELLRVCRKFQRSAELDEFLDILEERGYILREDTPSQRGAPSIRIFINPNA